jgi:hypothetical protein
LPLPAKLRLGAEILSTYVRMRWAMGRTELPQLVERVRAEGVARPTAGETDARRLAGAVMGMLAVLPTDSRCLVRSLVYLSLLARRGIAATLVIGVRSEPSFAAHAWVERDGEALLPSGDGEFRPLTVI